MTEQEWLTSEAPAMMLRSLEREWDKGGTYYAISDRKLRLFACACALTAFDDLSSPSRVDWERWVDSPRLDEMTAVEGAAYWCGRKVGQQLLKQLTMEQKRVRAALLRDIVGNPFRPVVLPKGPACARCDYGRPGEYTPDDGWGISGKCKPCGGTGYLPCPWLTPTVLSLAQAAYDERRQDGTLDPDRLAIPADALEEAGCTEEALLRHLRGWEWSPPEDHMGRDKGVWIRLRGPHVRGCWALDLILRKEVMCNV